MPLRSLSLVSYAARGLEAGEHRRRSDVPLASGGAEAAGGGGEDNDNTPSEAERSRVDGVLSEWDDLPAYLPRVNAPGSRIGSYREGSPSGATLAGFLELARSAEGGELLSGLGAFRAAVDELLPGRYAWLADESLHCTVRALDGGAG